METVHDILRHKGDSVFSVLPNDSVFQALEIMAGHNVGALLVMDKNKKLKGIFSERDYARKIVLQGKASKETEVQEIMSTKICVAKKEMTIEEAMAIMTRNKCRHLPVMEDENVIGLVSIGDVVNAVIHEKEFLIDQLEHYIAGSL